MTIVVSYFIFDPFSGIGQSIKGRVCDTSLKKDCLLAVVALMLPDSTLVQYTRSHKDGGFSFLHVSPGPYRIFITHPSYSEFTIPVVVLKDGVTDLGILSLPPKVDVLSTVIVTPRSLSPQMRGDTLEYNTSHVKTRLNATVEELLNRLPGVQVDQNGGITVNGKKIERLLVDGEVFFGGDPTTVTKNFNADMIAKVQVLDKKSGQSEFSGVDDGQRTKTLNLALKEDSKRGYFVKAEAEGDMKDYYNINGLLGAFNGRKQFAALGMMSNTGITGFSGNIGELGSGLNIGGGINDALDASAGKGVPQVISGGMHYANKWNGNENHAVGNYNYGLLRTNPFSSFITRQTLPDSIYTQQQQSNSINTQNQHNLNIDYDYIPDTISAFRFSLGGNSTDGNNELISTGSSTFNNTLVNNSLREIHSNIENQQFRGGLMWRRRGRKKANRNFSIITGILRQSNTTRGFLYSSNNFFQPHNRILGTDTIDQRKGFSNAGLVINSSLNYTELLWKNILLGASYGISINSSRATQATYSRAHGIYDHYIDSLSNDFKSNIFTQRVTINMQIHDKTFRCNLGADLLHYTYKQADEIKNYVLRHSYINFSPRINAFYNINNFKGFDFNYSGLVHQPSITQLQPALNNNDPLHIRIGNPNLHPSFSHNFSLNFHDLKPLILNLGLNFGFATHDISDRTYTDTMGRQISQTVNVSGSKSAGIYCSISSMIKPIDLNFGLSTNLSYGRSVNYVNQYLSQNDNYNMGGGISLNKFVAEKYSFQFNCNFNYFYSRSSINLAARTYYWTQSHNAQFAVFLLGFEISTSAYYNWRQKLDDFDKNNSTILWNAFINKEFFSNRLAIRWQINDILGQNIGISRNITANQTTESRFNIIGRYWILSATWRFIRHQKLN